MARPPSATRALLGRLLVASWLPAIMLVVAHIRIASDDGGEFPNEDASFGWPGREREARSANRTVHRMTHRLTEAGEGYSVSSMETLQHPSAGVGLSWEENMTVYRINHRLAGRPYKKECCIPAAFKLTHNPRDVACFGTCYTERACVDPLYPFGSLEEKALFPMSELDGPGRAQLSRECRSPGRMTPPMEWCQETVEDANGGEGAPARLVGGIPPAGCRQVTNGGGSGAFQHVLVFPSARLAFCGIPKVGITQWEQFLRFTLGAKDYPAFPHAKLDREMLQFDKLEAGAQRRIWEERGGWTWAAFVREPAERLLSAYLDKIKGKEGRKKHSNDSLSFEDFIDRLSLPSNYSHCRNSLDGMRGLNWCSDPHWRPQVYSCGISERLDRFEFIGDLRSAANHTEELLRRVGLWASHGARFISGGVKAGWNPFCHVMPHPANQTIGVGFLQGGGNSNQSAADVVYRRSRDSGRKMDAYYTPELLRRVREGLYADDYRLWRLVSENGGRLSKGKNLASKLSSGC